MYIYKNNITLIILDCIENKYTIKLIKKSEKIINIMQRFREHTSNHTKNPVICQAIAKKTYATAQHIAAV